MSSDMKLNVANYFISNAPINEVKLAVNEVKTIIDDDNVFTDAVQTKMLHKYNMNQLVHVDDGAGNRFLISPHNEVTPTTFFNPDNNKVYEINHIDKICVAEVGTHGSSNNEALRAGIAAALKKYASTNYKKEKCVTGVYASGNSIIMCISAINTNLGAFWTGNWRATYKYDIGASQITGKMEVNVHYFEDGNVQLNAAYEPREHTSVSPNDADSIAAAIAKIENEWQANIEKMYIDMHHQTFKNMRRALPLSKTTFNWASQAHSLARELGK